MNNLSILFLLSFIHVSLQYSAFFNHWHCIGIKEKIDFSKPYKINIGELPLVLWKDERNDKLVTTVNVCKHMGSKLDNGKILDNGCLQCQYHGLEMSQHDSFGQTVEHEGKLFWSYKPSTKKPHSIPFFKNKDYETSFLEVDMDCSLQDSAYNTMDIKHPSFVHNKLVGFGSLVPPENVKHYSYKLHERIGLYFEYSSNKVMRAINDGIRKTKNFHMYVYPSFTWSRVTFEKKHLILGVNFLPLKNNKTRWYVTLCHNYYKSEIGKNLMKMMAFTILNQDYQQMMNQYEENKLKSEIIFNHTFEDEEPIHNLHNKFAQYKYPTIEECVELYKDHKSQKKSDNIVIPADTFNVLYKEYKNLMGKGLDI